MGQYGTGDLCGVFIVEQRIVLGGDYSLEGEADRGGIEGLLGAAGRTVDGDGNVGGGVVVLVLCRGVSWVWTVCRAWGSYAQVLVCANVAEALQHAQDFAALGQVGRPRGDAQVDRARRQLGDCSSGSHGGLVECGLGEEAKRCAARLAKCSRQVGRPFYQSSPCISRACTMVPGRNTMSRCHDACGTYKFRGSSISECHWLVLMTIQ
jgi:hypothetical protein